MFWAQSTATHTHTHTHTKSQTSCLPIHSTGTGTWHGGHFFLTVSTYTADLAHGPSFLLCAANKQTCLHFQPRMKQLAVRYATTEQKFSAAWWLGEKCTQSQTAALNFCFMWPKQGGRRRGKLVGWYFEPSQPQRVTSGLKTNFNLSPGYSAHKSLNYKFSQIDEISPDTNLH